MPPAIPATGTAQQRIALLLPALEDGGAERVMLQLGSAFHARGYAVDLVLATTYGPLLSEIPPQLRVVELAAPRTAMALPALVRYLRRDKPAALLATLEHTNILAVWAGFLARSGTRVILREANVVLPPGPTEARGLRVQRALMRRVYPGASAIVAVSQGVAESLVHGLGISSDQIVTIYNPIVTPDLEEKANGELNDPWFAPGAPPVVLGVGRLVPQKDFPTLLRAFALVRQARPARLVILGEGQDRRALEALVQELGLSADVRLPGYDRNPFRYMKRAAVFALSSIFEGLPGALIQAMACGCRVISTDCPGGSREILEGNPLAKLVPPGHPAALARGIEALLRDAEQGPARASHSLDHFTQRATIDQYLRVLGLAQ